MLNQLRRDTAQHQRQIAVNSQLRKESFKFNFLHCSQHSFNVLKIVRYLQRIILKISSIVTYQNDVEHIKKDISVTKEQDIHKQASPF